MNNICKVQALFGSIPFPRASQDIEFVEMPITLKVYQTRATYEYNYLLTNQLGIFRCCSRVDQSKYCIINAFWEFERWMSKNQQCSKINFSWWMIFCKLIVLEKYPLIETESNQRLSSIRLCWNIIKKVKYLYI